MGFRFDEVMSGTYAPVNQPDETRAIRFSIAARASSTWRALRDGRVEAEGVMDMEGFATAAPLRGTMTILPVTRRIIRYELSFAGDDGQPYQLRGQKDIEFRNLRRSFTWLPASIYDRDGRLVARADTEFDARHDLVKFLRSWRAA